MPMNSPLPDITQPIEIVYNTESIFPVKARIFPSWMPPSDDVFPHSCSQAVPSLGSRCAGQAGGGRTRQDRTYQKSRQVAFPFPLSSLRTERHREREDLHLSGIRSGQGAAGNMDTVQPAFPDCGILPASDGTHGRSAGLPVPPLS